jgi:hypothetical protein
MALCKVHVRDFTVGPPKPGFSRDLKTPHGQVGGTRANEMCPRCMWPPEARALQEQADELNMRIARAFLLPEIARLTSMQDQVRARLDELNERGIVHKCPLRLTEVS